MERFIFKNSDGIDIQDWEEQTESEVISWLKPNDEGFIYFPVSRWDKWLITMHRGNFHRGDFDIFTKISGIYFIVNDKGFIRAKAGTKKGEVLQAFIKRLADVMQRDRGDIRAYLKIVGFFN